MIKYIIFLPLEMRFKLELKFSWMSAQVIDHLVAEFIDKFHPCFGLVWQKI